MTGSGAIALSVALLCAHRALVPPARRLVPAARRGVGTGVLNPRRVLLSPNVQTLCWGATRCGPIPKSNQPQCAATIHCCADAVLECDKVWANAVKPESSLLSVPGLGKLPAGDAQHLVPLLECLLAEHRGRLEVVPGAHDAVSRCGAIGSVGVGCLLDGARVMRTVTQASRAQVAKRARREARCPRP